MSARLFTNDDTDFELLGTRYEFERLYPDLSHAQDDSGAEFDAVNVSADCGYANVDLLRRHP